MTGLIVLLMGLGLAGQLAAPPPPGLYQFTIAGGQVLRMDTRTGSISPCTVEASAIRCEAAP